MPKRNGVEGCPGWKVIWTMTGDLGRSWFATYFMYEYDAVNYANQKDNREGELDPILEEGWYSEAEWETSFQAFKTVIWNEEDLLPGEPKVWIRKGFVNRER